MTFEERQSIIEKAFKRRSELMRNKGKEYSKGIKTDVNFNFKEVAKRLGLTKEQVLMVYFLKAILSIEKWILDGELSSGETIISRLDDARNYLDILETLLYEDEKKKTL